MKILVADDDPVSRRLMERMLQRGGYEVITVQNGRQAAHELSRVGGPRLALIDWMMPELDGPSLCRELRSRQNDSYVYILLLTSKQSGEEIVEGLEAGADDYLTKPCHAAELKARLHTGRRILQLEDKLVEAGEEMRFKATHDGLTSLWDRGAFLGLLRSELSRSIREHLPVSLLLCDVDHFKQINDVYGHQAGDDVLQEVSTRLLDAVRSHDAVGRYGGEEFLIVLNNCDSSHAAARAEEVRNGIAKQLVQTMRGPLTITMSLGVLTSRDWDIHLVEDILIEADSALYQAKAEGRNCVRLAKPTVLFHVPSQLVK